MEEALLDHEAAAMRVVEEEEDDDEMLWNALNEDDGSAEARPLTAGNDALYEARENATSHSVHLPSLRADVHIPAISNMLERIADSAKSTLMQHPRRHRGAAARENAGVTGASTRTSSASSGSSRSTGLSNVPDEFGRVANLDAFLITLYNYFYHKGFLGIAVVEIVSLLTGVFGVTLSSFLMGCVQWRELIACTKQGDECHKELEEYVSCSAHQPGMLHLVVAFYFALFFVYWVFRVLQLASTLKDTYRMRSFFTERLNIDQRQLQTISWDEVVTRVMALVGVNGSPKHLKQISSYRLQIDPALLSSPQDFARRIMRRENYLIAFMNHSLFQGADIMPSKLRFLSTAHVMFSRNMEFNLNLCLIDRMFDTDFELSPLINNVEVLQKRFMIAGVLNLVATPFLLIYRVFHFLFLSSLEWHMNKVHYFGTRRWSTYALWKFREYNELPHVLEARMARSYPQAERYLSLFPTGPLGVIAGGISFCISALMGVLLVFAFFEDRLLLGTTLFGRSLTWYLGVTAGTFGFVRMFTSETSPFLTNGDCEEAMLQLSTETHYFPQEWRGLCHSFDVRDAFLELFPFKAQLFLEECISVIFAPFVLCFSLPHCSREVLLFIRSHSLALPGVGAVCRYAEFDFQRYNDDAKMERSFINFKQNHPTWVGADEGEQLMQRLGQIKEQEMEKSLHMGDTMLLASQNLSLSQQLLQSQAIHTAMGTWMTPLPQDNEFYWLEKLRQRGHLGESSLHEDEKEASADPSMSFASVRV